MARLRTIQQSESLDAVWEELVYTEARFLVDPLAKDLAAAHTALIERLEQARTNQRRAWRDEIVAQANIDAQNVALDATTVRFGAKLLAAVNGNRSTARWKRYFPDTVSAVVRLALGRQVEKLRGWPASLQGETEPELQAFSERFKQHLTEAEASLHGRIDAAARRADQRVREITTLIDDVNATRMDAMGKLLNRTVQHELSRDWAEGFFRRAQRQVRADDESDGGDGEGGGADQG
jgi:hypothetical protein